MSIRLPKALIKDTQTAHVFTDKGGFERGSVATTGFVARLYRS